MVLNALSNSIIFHCIFFLQVTKKEYKKFSHTFTTLTDLQQYWYQLWSISMNTPLGFRSFLSKCVISVENINSKPEMMQVLSSRNHRTAVLNDIGWVLNEKKKKLDFFSKFWNYSYIPGDHAGAAGLDSGMWPHLKYNWIKGKRPNLRRRNNSNALNQKLAKIKPIKFEELEQMRKDSYEGATPKVKVKKQKKQKIKIPLKKTANKKRSVYYDKIG